MVTDWAVKGAKVLAVYAPSQRNRPPRVAEAEISKVGKKWAYLGEGRLADRFRISNGQIDGGDYASPGRVWPDRLTYETHLRKVSAWAIIEGRANRWGGSDVPEHLTADELEAFAVRLQAEPNANDDED